MDNLLESAMQIIMYSGEARGFYLNAINLAQDGKITQAKKEAEKGKEQLLLAHKMQTNLISKECSGETMNVSLLIVHSQDHLMTTMTIRDLSNAFFKISEQIKLLQGGKV